MNTRHAQIVLTIARFGSITAAAKALYLTQPTLSATLKQIETQLGEPIFVRGRTPLELTRAGELYVQAARHIVQIETQLDEAIASLHGRNEGTLRLGMPLRRSCELLPQILPEYMKTWPDVRLEVFEGRSDELEQKLTARELDMALLAGDTRRQDLSYRLIASEELVLLAGRQTALAQRIPSGSTINLAEAASERFILPGDQLAARRTFDSLLTQGGVFAAQPALVIDSLETGKRLCAACQMVMLSPFMSLLCDTAAMQKLAHYHLTGEVYLHKFSMAHAADTALPPYAEAFYTMLSNRFRAMSAYRV